MCDTYCGTLFHGRPAAIRMEEAPNSKSTPPPTPRPPPPTSPPHFRPTPGIPPPPQPPSNVPQASSHRSAKSALQHACKSGRTSPYPMLSCSLMEGRGDIHQPSATVTLDLPQTAGRPRHRPIWTITSGISKNRRKRSSLGAGPGATHVPGGPGGSREGPGQGFGGCNGAGMASHAAWRCGIMFSTP